ncbi:hypothetical protein BGZ65_006003 [Modicella reniformis]|uniref:Arrestin C-terminal-like domain-containing protein n=1 Tax=Modicella reniformis TaxID=1440133 RepID=A0A9P6MM21_9FUNG|nr:hypothetical protein BGZ65_006003 [Modicella reniformis]
MRNPLSLDPLADNELTAKDMRLSIDVHGHSTIVCESKPLPVFYTTLDSPRVIRATVTLETDRECTGSEVEIIYKASATYKAPGELSMVVVAIGEQVFEKKRWLMELNRPSPGKVAAGRYTKEVTATINPLWPSSVRLPPHRRGFGWVKYVFDVRFFKYKTLSPILITSQEVWVLNSTLPSPSYLQPKLLPLVAQTTWNKSTLPITLTLPSETLTLGHAVPVTVQMSPFTNKSKYSGQTIDVLRASFILREHVHGYSRNSDQHLNYTRDVISVPIIEGWPHSVGPWQKTVNLTLPTSPELSPTTTSEFLNLSYSLILAMKLKAGKQRDRKADEYKLQANVHIVVPRRAEAESNGDTLPAYCIADDDEKSRVDLAY